MNIEEIQTYCNSLPGVTESVKWDDHLCFCIGEKMFAVTSLSGANTISFKVADEEFAALIEQENFISAPYLGRYKWVFMEDFTSIADKKLKDYIRQSYGLIKSKLSAKMIKTINQQSNC